jgi:hypothetical protein
MGLDLSRVVEIYAESRDEGTIGSGYLVTDQLILTAGHVIRGATRVDVRPLGTAEWLVSTSVWPGDSEVDITLLRPQRPERLSTRRAPVRWGSVRSATEPISCTAVGFPWAQARPTGRREVRDTEQIFGHVAPLGHAKSGRLAITVISTPPIARTDSSGWEGMSGAAVFAGPYLIGLVAIDPARFGAARLVAVSIEELAKDKRFARLLCGEDTLAVTPVRPRLRLDLTPNLSLVLRPPYRALPKGFQLANAPAELLVAEHGVVPFLERTEFLRETENARSGYLEEIEQWCDALDPFSIRVVTGQGGIGKSRLAAEVCVRQSGKGWAVGFADIKQSISGTETSLELEDPMLVVVDDADEQVSLVAGLVRYFSYHLESARPLRILLLARQLGSWHDELRKQQPKVDGYMAKTILLDRATLDQGDRTSHFEAAARAFAVALETQAEAVGPLWPLSNPGFELPLLVHMNALLATIGEVADVSSKSTIQDQVIGRILRREKQRWDTIGAIHSLGDLDAQVAHRAVAVATLTEADTEADAVDLLAAIEDITDRERRGRVVRWLHELHSGDLYLNALKPDLLAEQMLVETPALSSLVVAIHSNPACGHRYTIRLLNRLHAIGERRSQVRAALENLVAQRLQVLADESINRSSGSMPNALNQAMELISPGESESMLERVTTIESILKRIALRDGRLASLAATLAAVAVRDLRSLAREGTDQSQRRLGTMLSALSFRLWDVARHDDAVDASREAVVLLRPLAKLDIQSREDFATALNTLNLILSWSEKWSEAQPIAQEAVDVRRQLETSKSTHAHVHLAGALLNQGVVLSALSNPKAIVVTKQAARIFKRLAGRDSKYSENYGSTCVNLAIRRHEFGQHHRDLRTLSAAIRLFRRLANQEPHRYLHDLAWALGTLGRIHAAHFSFDDAVKAQQESVERYHEAAAANPDLYTEPLVRSLNANAELLYGLGRPNEALDALEKAIDSVRPLTRTNPEKFLANLTVGLRNLADLRWQVGDREGARRAREEANEIATAIPEPEAES